MAAVQQIRGSWPPIVGSIIRLPMKAVFISTRPASAPPTVPMIAESAPSAQLFITAPKLMGVETDHIKTSAHRFDNIGKWHLRNGRIFK